MTMKAIVWGALLSALGVVLGGCSQFPTAYDRVDNDKVRLLDFIYEPAEAAPGDSVTLVAVFSGRDPNIDNIQWDVSYKVVRNAYGQDTAFNSAPLAMLRFDTTFSAQTYAVGLRFKVPETIVSDGVYDRSLLEQVLVRMGSDGGATSQLSPDSLVQLLDAMAQRAPQWRGVLARDSTLEDSLVRDDALFAQYRSIAPLLPLACQVFTANMRLFATIPGSHRIRSDYAVRYSSALAGLPGSALRLNYNPRIDSIGLYSVKGEMVQFIDPANTPYSFTYRTLYRPGELLVDTPSVHFDKGYSYVLTCFANGRDSALTIDAFAQGGQPVAEKLRTQWYFALDAKEAEAVDPFKYPNIENNGNLVCGLFPAIDTRISRATIWLELRDELLNELNRPQGSTLQEFSLNFTYSEAYKRSLK
jgi:hypothetical protein